MLINDQTGSTYGGLAIATYLRQRLTFFEQHSNAAQQLLGPINADNSYTVTIATSKSSGGGLPGERRPAATATREKAVTLNPAECGQGKRLTWGDELVESAVFELTNATLWIPSFKPLLTQVNNAGITPLAYGLAKARVEAEATWNIATILRELGNNYAPTEWGEGQLTNTAGFVNAGLDAYRDTFADLPHKKDDDGNAVGLMGLPSKFFYAVNGAQMLAGAPKQMNNVVTIKRKGNYGTGMTDQGVWRKVKFEAIAARLTGNGDINSQKLESAKFYRAVIDAAKAIAAMGANFAVVWKAATTAQSWDFNPDMEAETPDPSTSWTTEIKNLITGQNYNSKASSNTRGNLEMWTPV